MNIVTASFFLDKSEVVGIEFWELEHAVQHGCGVYFMKLFAADPVKGVLS